MRVLITSFGSIAKRHLRNVKSLLPDSEVCVFRGYGKHSGAMPEGVHRFVYSLDDCLSFKPDLAIIASPASEHVKIAVPLLEQGIPCFIEKPLADNAGSLEKLRQMRNLPFVMVGYVLRFQPIFQDIKRFVASQRLGRILLAQIQVGQYLPDWRPDSDYREGVSAQQKLGGGALLELSHEIDYATWLLGWPNRLYCSCSKISDLEIDVEDHAMLIFEIGSPEQRKVQFQLDFLQRVPQMTLQIVGSKGTLRADLIKEQMKFHHVGDPTGENCEVLTMNNGNEMYLRQFDLFFHKAVVGYKPIFDSTADFKDWATLSSSSKVIEIVDKAKKSNISGNRVHL